MPRKTKKAKPHIYVFCEGESEQAYTDFLKEHFEDVAVIKKPKSTGLFEFAKQKFNNDATYKSNAEITDEIWFFYDVEKKDIGKVEARQKIINELRRLRKKPNIRVRLLMTTACIEYWLMLHYKCFAPSIETEAEKDKMLRSVVAKESTYEKDDSSYQSTYGGWSWRYYADASEQEVTLDANTSEATLVFNNERVNDQGLSGGSWLVNEFTGNGLVRKPQ